jgi:hypothetical protein
MSTLGKYYLMKFEPTYDDNTRWGFPSIPEINGWLEVSPDRLVETNFITKSPNQTYCVLTMYRHDEDET